MYQTGPDWPSGALGEIPVEIQKKKNALGTGIRNGNILPRLKFAMQ